MSAAEQPIDAEYTSAPLAVADVPAPSLFSSMPPAQKLAHAREVATVLRDMLREGKIVIDENGNEKVIWRAKLPNIPSRAIVVESGKYVITLDSWRSIGFDHCLVVYGEHGKVIADFRLEDLLTSDEIASLPGSITERGWSDQDVAEFEDRSREEDELVIRMKYKDWTKVIRLSLSTGKLVKE